MRYFILIAVVFSSNSSFAQDSKGGFLFNSGIVTYVDREEGGNFAVSFKADTVMPSEHKNVYLVDTMIVQFSRFKIPPNMIGMKYDAEEERKLFMHFHDYEFNYMQDTLFKESLASIKEFFSNQNSKLFLLWYFRIPKQVNVLKGPSVPQDSSTLIRQWTADYQVFLVFTSGNFVRMINTTVYEGEDLSRKIEYLKKFVANSVRLYDGQMSVSALDNQLKYKLQNKVFEIDDTTHRFKFVVPFWLNLIIQDCPLFGVFPDINNISNALGVFYIDKSKYPSFQSFEDKMLKSKAVRKVTQLPTSTDRIHLYKLIFRSGSGYDFTCQYVFLDLTNVYALVNFTATEHTYERNIAKFNEFMRGITIY